MSYQQRPPRQPSPTPSPNFGYFASQAPNMQMQMTPEMQQMMQQQMMMQMQQQPMVQNMMQMGQPMMQMQQPMMQMQQLYQNPQAAQTAVKDLAVKEAKKAAGRKGAKLMEQGSAITNSPMGQMAMPMMQGMMSNVMQQPMISGLANRFNYNLNFDDDDDDVVVVDDGTDQGQGKKNDGTVVLPPPFYFETKSTSTLHFIEVILYEAKDVPDMNYWTSGSDPYVIMNLESVPEELHKSKIIKRENNPKYNEVFGFVLPDSKVVKGKVKECLVLNWKNWSSMKSASSIGAPLIIKLDKILTEKKVGIVQDDWYPVPKAKEMQVRIGLVRKTISANERPLQIKTHTGNSVRAFWNSITRTRIKMMRNGERGDETTHVHWLEVKVLSARKLPVVKNGRTDPYVIVSLNSSAKKRFRTPTEANTQSPEWNASRVYGFEVASVEDGRMMDVLKLQCNHYNLTGRAHKIGIGYLSLDALKLDQEAEFEVPLDNKDRSKVLVSVKRTLKHVDELGGGGPMQKCWKRLKMLYAMIKHVFEDLCFDLVIEIYVKVAGVGITQTISLASILRTFIDEKEAEEELAKDEDAPTELGEDDEDGNDAVARTAEEAVQAVMKGKSIVRKALMKLKGYIRRGLKWLRSQGFKYHFGFEAFQCGFEITVYVGGGDYLADNVGGGGGGGGGGGKKGKK